MMNDMFFLKLRHDYIDAVWELHLAMKNYKPTDQSLAKMRYINKLMKWWGKKPFRMRIINEGKSTVLYEYVGWSEVSEAVPQ